MNTTRRYLILFVILLTAACSMPVTRIYSLYIPAEDAGSARLNEHLSIHVASSDYLRQPYIADRSSPYQLHIAKYAKWEESPLRMVRNEFARAFSLNDVNKANDASGSDYTLNVRLMRFERFVMNGQRIASLDLDISLYSQDGQPLYHRAVVKEQPLQGDDFESLARALSELLGEAVREISDDIVRTLNR